MLVASDAVGMGLNLNIRRIIFHTMAKREGERRPPHAARPVGSLMCTLHGRLGFGAQVQRSGRVHHTAQGHPTQGMCLAAWLGASPEPTMHALP